MKFLSSPSTLNPPGTFALRKPRLARSGLLKPLGKFSQPAGVPHAKAPMMPKAKLISVGALKIPQIPRIKKL